MTGFTGYRVHRSQVKKVTGYAGHRLHRLHVTEVTSYRVPVMDTQAVFKLV